MTDAIECDVCGEEDADAYAYAKTRILWLCTDCYLDLKEMKH